MPADQQDQSRKITNVVPSETKHRHFHRLKIPENAVFNFNSNIKVIRTTMYEPVSNHCVTTTIIKPSIQCGIHTSDYDSSAELCTNNDRHGNHLIEDLPPQKPPRRHDRHHQKKRYMQISQEGTKMRNDNGDRCVDLEHITIENNIKRHRLNDASAQTSLIVPYRLRFWPTCQPRKKEVSCCGSCCLTLTRWLLSQLGLTVVVTLWALLGALAFFYTEGPRERDQSTTLAKIQKDLSIELATDLKKTSEHQEAWPSTIYKYFEKHETLFLEAVGAGYGEGGGGNIWTYPGCFLFAVSLLTTLGFGAPVPRTPLGRGAAVLFASVGIPLHFLLILNVGNLSAVSLRRLAFGESHSDVPVTPYPGWLKWFPAVAIVFYYMLGVVLFGFVRERAIANCFMFPLDFTAAGGVATVPGVVRVFYALYLEGAVTLAALVVSLVQASAARGIVDIGLKLGLLTNT